jgi:hypothetical protein
VSRNPSTQTSGGEAASDPSGAQFEVPLTSVRKIEADGVRFSIEQQVTRARR